jgi:hypothetical protein
LSKTDGPFPATEGHDFPRTVPQYSQSGGQQWSMMSSSDLKARFKSQLSRMNDQMFSTGLSSGEFGGKGMW